MMKKMIALCLVVVFLFFNFAPPIYALDLVDTTEGVGYYLEPSRIETINRLFSERTSLLDDIEANRDAIVRIDYQLESLGVDEMAFSEVAQKVYGNTLSPQANMPSTTSDTKWTSFRTIYVYRGVQYEIQDVKGVPNLDDRVEGEIFPASDYTLMGTANVSVSDVPSYRVDSKEALRIILGKIGETVIEGAIDEIAGEIPELVTIGKTIYDTLAMTEDLSKLEEYNVTPISVLNNVGYTCEFHMDAVETYLFVKTPGNPDEGYQIFAYGGNQIECTLNYEFEFRKMVDGEAEPDDITSTVDYTVSSPDYYFRYEKAVKNYLEYKQGYNLYDDYIYLVYEFDFEMHRDIEGYNSGSDDTVTVTIETPVDEGMFQYCF